MCFSVATVEGYLFFTFRVIREPIFVCACLALITLRPRKEFLWMARMKTSRLRPLPLKFYFPPSPLTDINKPTALVTSKGLLSTFLRAKCLDDWMGM
jgi:hypothetical protein